MRSDEISNSDDVIDSRQIIARIKELHETVDERDPTDPEAAYDDERSELAILEDLQEQAQGYSEDWKYGSTLIRGSYFTEYAQQLAENIGAVKDDAGWPSRHIDWEAAADELKQDYTEVEFDGVAYWVR